MSHFLKRLAAWAVAGALLPAGGRAQALDTVRGLHIQRAAAGVSPGPRITLDGQRRDSTALAGLNPDAIATISVLKADAARRLGPDEARLGVLVTTTKAGEHTHSVRAFDKRLTKLRQANPPTPPPATSPK